MNLGGQEVGGPRGVVLLHCLEGGGRQCLLAGIRSTQMMVKFMNKP